MGFWAAIPLVNAARAGLGLVGLPAAVGIRESVRPSSASSVRSAEGYLDAGQFAVDDRLKHAPPALRAGNTSLKSNAAPHIRVGRLNATKHWDGPAPTQKANLRKVFEAISTTGPWFVVQPMMGVLAGRETQDTGYRVHLPDTQVPGKAPLNERWKRPQTEVLPVDELHGVSLLGGSGERIQLPSLPGNATADRGLMDAPLMSRSENSQLLEGQLQPLVILYGNPEDYELSDLYAVAYTNRGGEVAFKITQSPDQINTLVIPQLWRTGLPPGSMAEFVKIALEEKYGEIPSIHAIKIPRLVNLDTLNAGRNGKTVEDTTLGKFVIRLGLLLGYRAENMSVHKGVGARLEASLIKTEDKQPHQFFYRAEKGSDNGMFKFQVSP